MLLNILIGILATIGTVVVLAIGTIMLIYFVLLRRLKGKVRQQMEQFEAMVSDTVDARRVRTIDRTATTDPVPPMDISLVPYYIEQERVDADPLNQRIDRWLRKMGFKQIGFFEIQELEEIICTYIDREQTLLASIRDMESDNEMFVEFCFDLGDCRRGGVSNPPHNTLPLPPDAVGRFFPGNLRDDFSLMDQMYAEARSLMSQHSIEPIDPNYVDEFYECAHAAEIEARIEAGGISEDEIRATLSAQGGNVKDSEVASIAREWQYRVDDYLLDYAESAQDLSNEGDDILVVHDRSGKIFLTDRMVEFLIDRGFNDREQLLKLKGELADLLQRFTPRDAIARFRPLLPNELRYRLVDQIQDPLPADFYAL